MRIVHDNDHRQVTRHQVTLHEVTPLGDPLSGDLPQGDTPPGDPPPGNPRPIGFATFTRMRSPVDTSQQVSSLCDTSLNEYVWC